MNEVTIILTYVIGSYIYFPIIVNINNRYFNKYQEYKVTDSKLGEIMFLWLLSPVICPVFILLFIYELLKLHEVTHTGKRFLCWIFHLEMRK